MTKTAYLKNFYFKIRKKSVRVSHFFKSSQRQGDNIRNYLRDVWDWYKTLF